MASVGAKCQGLRHEETIRRQKQGLAELRERVKALEKRQSSGEPAGAEEGEVSAPQGRATGRAVPLPLAEPRVCAGGAHSARESGPAGSRRPARCTIAPAMARRSRCVSPCVISRRRNLKGTEVRSHSTTERNISMGVFFASSCHNEGFGAAGGPAEKLTRGNRPETRS